MSKVILVTGVSSGFGREIARQLASAGHKVYGTVRKITEARSDITLLQMDLMDHESLRAVAGTVTSREGRIDVLINNAGMHTGGPIEFSPLENIRNQMDTNFLGMACLTQLVLPSMREQGGGTIINFGSIGGMMGLPFQGFYSASKFAIEGFSEALRMEVGRFNIRIVVINPGDFHTSNSANRRNWLAPLGEENPYRRQFEQTLSIIEKDESGGGDPARLASEIVKIVGKKNPRQRYIIASPEQKLAVVLSYILPAKWFRKILEGHYRVDSKT